MILRWEIKVKRNFIEIQISLFALFDAQSYLLYLIRDLETAQTGYHDFHVTEPRYDSLTLTDVDLVIPHRRLKINFIVS